MSFLSTYSFTRSSISSFCPAPHPETSSDPRISRKNSLSFVSARNTSLSSLALSHSLATFSLFPMIFFPPYIHSFQPARFPPADYNIVQGRTLFFSCILLLNQYLGSLKRNGLLPSSLTTASPFPRPVSTQSSTVCPRRCTLTFFVCALKDRFW